MAETIEHAKTTANSPWLDYFDRIEIIHMRDRRDRYVPLVQELAHVGIDIHHDRVHIPEAPRPTDAYGFPSRQIFGNFLSHLDILRRARNEKHQAVLVLEDDTIFRTFLTDLSVQSQFVHTLKTEPWDICYFGHPITRQLNNQPRGLIRTDLTFCWMHCYAVHQRVLDDLVAYLEDTMERPVGHPDGGKMYIDGAISMFRDRSPQVVTLVSNPTVSIQRGSVSGIADRSWYDQQAGLQKILAMARATRDEVWRRTGHFG